MKNIRTLLFLIVQTALASFCFSQEIAIKEGFPNGQRLFESTQPLAIQLKYSNKKLKKETNDSIYLESMLWFKEGAEPWDSIKTDLRARGNFRRENCYYAPLKLKIKRGSAKGSLFEGTGDLKLVLPCLLERDNDDFVIKEYLAYKLFEIIAPYHFKTRLTTIHLLEEKGNRLQEHELTGFVIEDMDDLSDRYQGREIERKIHPLQYDALASIQNSFFQYMIANTDYSTKLQHNQKLLFTDRKIIPIPYDFDMSGLVDANYAAVTNIQNLSKSISVVTQRIYKGYEREEALLQEVRQDYLGKKDQIFKALNDLEEQFQNTSQFLKAKRFLESFFETLESDKKFEKNILNRQRTR